MCRFTSAGEELATMKVGPNGFQRAVFKDTTVESEKHNSVFFFQQVDGTPAVRKRPAGKITKSLHKLRNKTTPNNSTDAG